MAAVLLTIATAWAACVAGVVFGFLRAARNAPVAPPTAEADWIDVWLTDTPVYAETCAAEAARIAAAELDADLADLFNEGTDR